MLPTICRGGFKREGDRAGARPGALAAGAAVATVALALTAGCSNGGGRGKCGPTGKAGAERRRGAGRGFGGFFVALDRGLFKAQGLTVNFIPVSSSETAIASQVAGAYDITGGN